MGRDDEDQPKNHVKNGNAGKTSRYAPFDVMKNGQELQVFIIEDLLWIWRRHFHAEEISRARSIGLAKTQPPFGSPSNSRSKAPSNGAATTIDQVREPTGLTWACCARLKSRRL